MKLDINQKSCVLLLNFNIGIFQLFFNIYSPAAIFEIVFKQRTSEYKWLKYQRILYTRTNSALSIVDVLQKSKEIGDFIFIPIP